MTTIFVGNISYDVSKEDIVKLFSEAGDVLGFRFVTEKDSGKSRGFGFCEFRTEDEAELAIERFNNMTLKGRTLKVDSADGNQDGSGVGPKGGRQQKDIEKALSQLGLIKLYDLLFNFKELIANDYQKARKIIIEYPVLAQALVKICSIFDEVNNPKKVKKSGHHSSNQVINDLTQDLMNNIMTLTPEQIQALPEPERLKVLEIIQQQLVKETS